MSKELTWINGADTGISSKTIWAVMMDVVAENGWYGTPSDGADFGRCYRLIELVPEWKSQLYKVSDRFPEWRPLVDQWDLLEDSYKEDLADNGSRTYELIKSLNDEIMKAGGYVKTGANSWEKNNEKNR